MRTRAIGFILSLLFPQLAAAQLFPIHHVEEPATEVMRAALDDPYGKMFVAILTDVIKKSASPGCQLLPSVLPLEQRVNAIVERRGIQIVATLFRSIDWAAFRDALSAKLGSGAFEEREALKGDPVVQAYTAIGARQRAAERSLQSPSSFTGL